MNFILDDYKKAVNNEWDYDENEENECARKAYILLKYRNQFSRPIEKEYIVDRPSLIQRFAKYFGQFYTHQLDLDEDGRPLRIRKKR